MYGVSSDFFCECLFSLPSCVFCCGYRVTHRQATGGVDRFLCHTLHVVGARIFQKSARPHGSAANAMAAVGRPWIGWNLACHGGSATVKFVVPGGSMPMRSAVGRDDRCRPVLLWPAS